MTPIASGHVKLVKWGEFQKQFLSAKPEVTQAFKRFAPLKDCSVFIAEYSYGDSLVTNGRFCTPCDAASGTSECDLCKGLRHSVSYSAIPLGLLLANHVEVHLNEKQGGINFSSPLRILEPKDFFGVFETIASIKGTVSTAPWNLSAGARSIHVMAHLNNARRLHSFLYDLDQNIPSGKDLAAEDWMVVKTIVHLLHCPYKVEIAILPKATVQALWKSDALRAWLLEECEEQSRHLRDQAIEAALQHLKGEKSNDDLSRTAMHVIRIARGDLPAFSPVSSSAVQFGPFRVVQDFLDQHFHKWNSKDSGSRYYPAILQPTHLKSMGDYGYYSLTKPSLLVKPQIVRKEDRARSSSDEMRNLMSRLKDLAKHDPFIDLSKTKAYHKQNHNEICRAEFIPAPQAGADMLPLCLGRAKSPAFFTGCLRIVRQ